MTNSAFSRAQDFAQSYGLRVPILMAPMAGSCPPELAAAVADAGGMGACGALMMNPDDIANWTQALRAQSNGAFQLNTWIPDPDPERDEDHETRLRGFLGNWGPEVPADAPDVKGPDFAAQCDAFLNAGPAVVSSIMGLYPPDIVAEMKARRIRWFATVTTVAEARAAVDAGADAVIAQGSEAGGHRGAFDARQAEAQSIGLFSLLPAVVDAVDVPVIATGGIGDARGFAAALILGASAVQIGTALLRTPEAGLPSAWADALGQSAPENTRATRAFSGRLGRAIDTDYLRAAHDADAPQPAPFPVQRALTGPMRAQGGANNDLHRMQAWGGQSAGFARAVSAKTVVEDMWRQTLSILSD